MRTLFKNALVTATVMATLSAIACSKGNNSGSPLAPSAGIPATASPAPAPTSGPAVGGATITGVVITGTQALTAGANLRAATVGRVTVSVVGTTAITVTDDNGNFTLQNVPAGSQTLSLNGNGIAAQVALAGVTTNEQIRITVRVEGGGATLDDRQRESADSQVEVEGVIASANGGTIVVGRLNTTVIVPASATVTRAGVALKVSDLVAGLRVEVHGVKSGTTITATRVNIEDSVTTGGTTPMPDDSSKSSGNDATEIEIAGTLTAKPTGSCPVIAFQVGSTLVNTSTSTQFDDAVCGNLAAGDTVKVEGAKQTNGSVLAKEVKRSASASGSTSTDDKGGSNKTGDDKSGSGKSGSSGKGK